MLGLSMTRILCETLIAGSATRNTSDISPEVSVPYENIISDSIVSSFSAEVFSHFPSRRYHHSIDAVSQRRVGDIGLPAASSSRRTQRDVAPRAIVVEIGRNSILATGPERTARVVSPDRPLLSTAVIRYTHTDLVYFAGSI